MFTTEDFSVFKSTKYMIYPQNTGFIIIFLKMKEM